MTIDTLPVELLQQVFHLLNDEDALSLRQASRNLETATFEAFGRRYFRKRGFLIVTHSLDTLQAISQHSGLCKYIEHVWFNPDCFTFVHEEWIDDLFQGEGGQEPMIPMQRRVDAVQAYSRDNLHLLYTTSLTKRLHDTFARLPNLHTIGMRRSEDHNAYGWTKLHDDTGIDPRELGPIPKDRDHTALSGSTLLFIAIINGLVGADVRLQRLYTDAIELDNIHPDDLSPHIFSRVMKDLLYLEVNMHITHILRGDLVGHGDFHLTGKTLTNDHGDCGSLLVQLLAASPQLAEIGLQVFQNRDQHHSLPPTRNGETGWTIGHAYKVFKNLASNNGLQHLTRIKLEKIATNGDTLWDILQPSAAGLSSLKLRDMRLLTTSEDERPWQLIFSNLAHQCPRLSYCFLYHLMYSMGGVTFADPAEVPVDSADPEDFFVDVVPAVHGNSSTFVLYEHISVEAKGAQQVQQKMEHIAEHHWYERPLFSYAMDESLWHTDTSDEE